VGWPSNAFLTWPVNRCTTRSQSTNVAHACWCSGTLQPCCARNVLSNSYHDRRISRGLPTAWPPRSPDLNPLDFYLCGHLKTLVYAAPFDNERHFTIALWMLVRLSATTPESLNGFGGPRWDMSRRALNFMQDIVSTYYECTFSAVIRKIKRFRTHFDMDIFSCNSCPKFVRTFQLHAAYIPVQYSTTHK
jgi:hypothetical protein